jgi:hypothetical protein
VESLQKSSSKRKSTKKMVGYRKMTAQQMVSLAEVTLVSLPDDSEDEVKEIWSLFIKLYLKMGTRDRFDTTKEKKIEERIHRFRELFIQLFPLVKF